MTTMLMTFGLRKRGPSTIFHRTHHQTIRSHPVVRAKAVRMKTARLAVMMTVLLASVGLGTVVTATPASAHGAGANGCTAVPDSGFGFSFHSKCDRHDRCYGTKSHGTDSAGRKRCDRAFRSDMLGYCKRHSPLSARGLSCRSVAWAYYAGVRALGYPFWIRSMPTPIA